MNPVHVAREHEDQHRRRVHRDRQRVLRRRGAPHRQARNGQHRQHQKADAASKVTAVNGNRKLRGRRGQRAQHGLALDRPPQERTPEEHRRREQHQPRNQAGEEGWRRCEQQQRAGNAAKEADDEEGPERLPLGPRHHAAAGVSRRRLPGKQRHRRGDIRGARVETGDHEHAERDERAATREGVLRTREGAGEEDEEPEHCVGVYPLFENEAPTTCARPGDLHGIHVS